MNDYLKIGLVLVIGVIIGACIVGWDTPEATNTPTGTIRHYLIYGESEFIQMGWGGTNMIWAKTNFLTVTVSSGYSGFSMECEIIEGKIYDFYTLHPFKIVEVTDNVLTIEVYDN